MTAAYTERSVPLTELGDRLAALRLFDATALASMRWSLSTHGQLSPLFAFKGGEGLEVYDGFKRLRAARGLGLRELRTVVMEVDIVEATVHMRELHAGRGLTALEEAWIVRSLHREHHLSQGAIATRLRCHKSWVCRRLMLVEALDTSVQADVRLGLLTPRAAVLVSALPRGNQSVASGAVIRRGLTVRQTAAFVRELVCARRLDDGTSRRQGDGHRAGVSGSPGTMAIGGVWWGCRADGPLGGAAVQAAPPEGGRVTRSERGVRRREG